MEGAFGADSEVEDAVTAVCGQEGRASGRKVVMLLYEEAWAARKISHAPSGGASRHLTRAPPSPANLNSTPLRVRPHWPSRLLGTFRLIFRICPSIPFHPPHP